MKKVNKQRCKKGFTLMEMLVVVLIIGILASVALPQYQMAVTKAKVASILPLMRRCYDALQEYKLQNTANDIEDTSVLGVSWPSDWKKRSDDTSCENDTDCYNDYWSECQIRYHYILCEHITNNGYFDLTFWTNDVNREYRNKLTCEAEGKEATKVCKALGGKLLEEYDEESGIYAI